MNKIYGFVMVEMSVKLKQRNPRKVISNQEMTNKSVMPYCP